jgi:hypothetical protein
VRLVEGVTVETVFLSQSFGELDRELIATVQALVEAAGMRVVTGDALGTGNVSDGVRRLIAASDACVAIATPATSTPGGPTHAWVQGEIVIANTLEKPCIALVSTGVKFTGAFSEKERIEYDPRAPLSAVAKLARTLALWRREAGRQVRVVPLPARMAEILGSNADTAECEYRLYDGQGSSTKWKKASIVPAAGAPVVHLKGASDESLIELRVTVRGQVWLSKAVPPFTHVTFKKAVAR